MKVHYAKLYNMVHFFFLNVFTASKGSNDYILFNKLAYILIDVSFLNSLFSTPETWYEAKYLSGYCNFY